MPHALSFLPSTHAPFLAEVFALPAACPLCGSRRLQRWGKTQTAGTPRFRCRDCGRTFTTFTGTPLARLRRRQRWPSFLACMQRSLPLRSTAQVVGINKDTAFRWRHRFLEFLLGARTECLGPWVELVNSRYFFYPKGEGNGYPASLERWAASHRGSRHQTATRQAVSAHGGRVMATGHQEIRSGRIQPLRAELPASFRPRVKAELAIVLAAGDQDGRFAAYALRSAFFGTTDAEIRDDRGDPLPQLRLVAGSVVLHQGGLPTRAFQRLCRRWSPEAVYVRASRRELILRNKAQAHLRPFLEIRQTLRRLQGWLKRFRGISIRWLQSYLTWFMALERAGAAATTREKVACTAVG